MPEPTVCTHPSAQRDVYRNNGRVFTYCRACDSDLTWTADIEGRRTKSPDRFMDARCVNCNQSHGPAVGGSESRVAPGQLADEERSAPPTDSAPDIGRSQEQS